MTRRKTQNTRAMGKAMSTTHEYTIKEYARAGARLYAEANGVSLPEGERCVNRDMSAFLSTLRIGEESAGPFGFGFYYKKLGRNRFIERRDLAEMRRSLEGKPL